MTPAAKRLRPATLEDLLALPEEDRYELVDGELVPKEAARGPYGRAQMKAGEILGPFHRRPGGPPDRPGGWWFLSEVDVYFDECNTLLPDVAGWRRERMSEVPTDRPVRIVPDWTCEILSGNKRNDLVKKKRVYHRAKVVHYWIIDPMAETLLVYRWGPDGYIEVLAAERGERVRAEPFDAIELPVGVFFGDDE